MQAPDTKTIKRQDLLKKNLINFLGILKSWAIEARSLKHNTSVLEEKLDETANTVNLGSSAIVASKFIELTREFWPLIEKKEKESLINLLENKKGNNPLLCSLSSLLALKGIVTQEKEEIFWHNLCGFIKLGREIPCDLPVVSESSTLIPMKAN